jgi:hypothetical protein
MIWLLPLGSAPAPGAPGRALAARSCGEKVNLLVRQSARLFGAGRAELQPRRLRSP